MFIKWIKNFKKKKKIKKKKNVIYLKIKIFIQTKKNKIKNIKKEKIFICFVVYTFTQTYEKNRKAKHQTNSIGLSINLLGWVCFVIMKTGPPRWELAIAL